MEGTTPIITRKILVAINRTKRGVITCACAECLDLYSNLLDIDRNEKITPHTCSGSLPLSHTTIKNNEPTGPKCAFKNSCNAQVHPGKRASFTFPLANFTCITCKTGTTSLLWKLLPNTYIYIYIFLADRTVKSLSRYPNNPVQVMRSAHSENVFDPWSYFRTLTPLCNLNRFQLTTWVH